MIRYTLVGSSDYDTFVRTINNLIKKGWLPQGGIEVVPTKTDNEYRFFQAMMIETEDTNG